MLDMLRKIACLICGHKRCVSCAAVYGVREHCTRCFMWMFR